jgi:cytochrome P450
MFKDEVYRFMECFGLNAGGLISISGDTWKHHRKLLNPCFTPKILESYIPIFNKCSSIIVENIEKRYLNGDVFNVQDDLLPCSLDLVVGE